MTADTNDTLARALRDHQEQVDAVVLVLNDDAAERLNATLYAYVAAVTRALAGRPELAQHARRRLIAEWSRDYRNGTTAPGEREMDDDFGDIIFKRAFLLAQAPAAAQPFVSSVRGQGTWAATAQSLADETRIRADELRRRSQLVGDR